VREVAMRFEDEISRAGSRLDLMAETPITGNWDRLRLEQVVSNLISNAIKYGGGKPIAVLVEGDDELGCLIVRDEGIGIAEVDQQRIFDRFERTVTVHRVGGFGLGLWISKQIVEAHGGTIRVQSEPGAGSSFVVQLPRAQPDA
jgi:signal transduction histidine kinase